MDLKIRADRQTTTFITVPPRGSIDLYGALSSRARDLLLGACLLPDKKSPPQNQKPRDSVVPWDRYFVYLLIKMAVETLLLSKARYTRNSWKKNPGVLDEILGCISYAACLCSSRILERLRYLHRFGKSWWYGDGYFRSRFRADRPMQTFRLTSDAGLRLLASCSA